MGMESTESPVHAAELTSCSVILYTSTFRVPFTLQQSPMPITEEQTNVGERVRELRSRAGLSVRMLAAEAGFSPSFISQVENGQASPSIASLERIAAALGVTLAGVFMKGEGDVAPVVLAGERQEVAGSWSRARIELLAPVRAGTDLESVMITVEPDGCSSAVPVGHPGEEFALCFDGEVTLTLNDCSQVLRRGDTVSFASETPHRWENRGVEAAQIVIVSRCFTH